MSQDADRELSTDAASAALSKFVSGLASAAPHTLTLEESNRAHEEWGANCGPGALAAVLRLSLNDVRPHLVGFAQKRYTNPRMMRAALVSLHAAFNWVPIRQAGSQELPIHGLARVQWGGPWMKPGVPIGARYRHTHWIAARRRDDRPGLPGAQIFDINAMSVGGWISGPIWAQQLVPWLLNVCQPKADGTWSITDIVEVQHP